MVFKKKVTDGPKPPIKAYQYWAENRNFIKPGDAYNAYRRDVKDKSQWEKLANDDKRRFDKEMIEYQSRKNAERNSNIRDSLKKSSSFGMSQTNSLKSGAHFRTSKPTEKVNKTVEVKLEVPEIDQRRSKEAPRETANDETLKKEYDQSDDNTLVTFFSGFFLVFCMVTLIHIHFWRSETGWRESASAKSNKFFRDFSFFFEFFSFIKKSVYLGFQLSSLTIFIILA